MTHLSDTEFVDLAEGTLDAARAAHLDVCARCREQAEETRAVLRDAQAVEWPEPSPLFWDHFSSRVRQRIAEEPEASGFLSWGAAVGWACAAAAVLLVLVTVRGLPGGTQPAPPSGASPSVARVDAQPASSVEDSSAGSPGSDVAWTLLRAAASDMKLHEAHAAGLSVPAGSIDIAVLELTPAERTELERLLRAELRRAGA